MRSMRALASTSGFRTDAGLREHAERALFAAADVGAALQSGTSKTPPGPRR
jgi:hypothetical protein